MLASDLARAGLVGAIPFTAQAWHAYVLAAAASSVGTVFRSARSALLPQLAPAERLVPTLALIETTHQVLHTVGPALGGAAVLWLGARRAFFLDAASFLLSAALILRIRPRGTVRASPRSALLEIRDGVRAVVSAPAVRAYAMVAFGLFLGFGGVVALLLGYVQDLLGRPGGDYGIVLGAAGLGTVLASLAIAARDAHHPRTPWVVASSGALVAFLLVLARPPFVALLPVALVAGLLDAGVGIPMSATVAEVLPDELRGRAYGALMALTSLALVAGSLGFAWVADHIGLVNGMALASGAGAILGIAALTAAGARAIAAHERVRLAPARSGGAGAPRALGSPGPPTPSRRERPPASRTRSSSRRSS